MTRRLYLFSSDVERVPALDGCGDGDFVVDIAGVGLVDAAIGAARAVQRHAPSEVVYVGTAGVFAGCGLDVGDALVPVNAVILSGDVARREMRLPGLLASEANADPTLSKILADTLRMAGMRVGAGLVGCTLGITESTELEQALRRSNDPVAENLEAFSVLRACQGIVPCAVVLGMTNIVGPGGGIGWKANYASTMKHLCAILTDQGVERRP